MLAQQTRPFFLVLLDISASKVAALTAPFRDLLKSLVPKRMRRSRDTRSDQHASVFVNTPLSSGFSHATPTSLRQSSCVFNRLGANVNGSSTNIRVAQPQIQSVLEIQGRPVSDDDTTHAPEFCMSPTDIPQISGELKLKPNVPSESKRYDRTTVVPEKSAEWIVDAFAMEFRYKRKAKQPEGWEPCVHPEGMLYHRKTAQDIVFLTDADVCEVDVLQKVNQASSELEVRIAQFLSRHKSMIPIDHFPLEVVLEAEDPKGDEWEYYIVDHVSQHILWVHKHTLTTNIYKGAESEAHIGHLLKVEYYQHLTYYPHYQKLSENFIDETRGILVWGLADSLTSLDSLTPYDEKTMDRFLKLMKHLKDLKDKAPAHYIATAARLRMVFENARFNNFSGLPCARLTRNQSVRGHAREGPSLSFRIISLLFLGVPAKTLKFLDGVYMDNIVFQAPFRLFVTRVSSGWQQDVINAAVLFTANIAFLAIPTLLPTDTGDINAAATASIVSIILSLSSIIFGQLLSKKIEALAEEPTNAVADYFADWWNPKRGLSKLAVMYSLPYVLMIWGAIAFILGIFIFTFRNFKANTQIIVIIAFLAGALLLCLWIVFEITGWCSLSPLFHHPKQLLMKMGLIPRDNDDKSNLKPNRIRRKVTLGFAMIVRIMTKLKPNGRKHGSEYEPVKYREGDEQHWQSTAQVESMV